MYDGRASWTALPGLTFSGEYAYEDGENFTGKGYYAQALYEFGDVAWKPSLTYRYALFNDEFNHARVRLHGLRLLVSGGNRRQLSAHQHQPEEQHAAREDQADRNHRRQPLLLRLQDRRSSTVQ